MNYYHTYIATKIMLLCCMVIRKARKYVLSNILKANSLSHNFYPANKTIKYSIETIEQHIAQEGYEHYQLNHTSIETIIDNSRNNNYGEYVIGKYLPFTKIDFMFDDKTGELFAKLSATDKEHAPVLPWIEATLKEKKIRSFIF